MPAQLLTRIPLTRTSPRTASPNAVAFVPKGGRVPTSKRRDGSRMDVPVGGCRRES